jgi:hypothetical protein
VVGNCYQVPVVRDGNVGQIYVNGVLRQTSAAQTFVANTDGAFTIGKGYSPKPNRSLLLQLGYAPQARMRHAGTSAGPAPPECGS